MSVFDCEDLFFSILEWISDDYWKLVKHVNSFFRLTIDKRRDASFSSSLKQYCSSVTLIKWAIEEGGGSPELCQTRGVLYAAELGNIEVLEWALKWARDQDPLFALNSTISDAAALAGHLSILQYLRAQNPPCPWSIQTCSNAALRGHVDVIEWMRSQTPPCPFNVLSCHHAAREGHLDALKCLRALSPPCPWNGCTFVFAVERGHFNILQWLKSLDPCPLQEPSIARGNLNILEWMAAQDPPC
jgi:hypothetical protein